ncbi:MAG: anion permease, partial [Deltaproteobacteria bacterium]|nr:anion permease [Deltaproteobacteria bacterium]
MTPRQVKKPAQSAFVVMAATILASLLFMSIEPPTGLSVAGQRVLGVAVIAIGLWGTELLPMGVTSMLTVVLLMFSRGVETLGDALVGFAQPVPYFLIAVLTIGLAVQKCGLAERIARFFLRQCRGRPRALYAHLLLAFPLLTLLLPSATVRTGILVHVYEQALSLSQVPKESALSKAIMMALNSINRLASTAILTGGITPVVAAALIGGMSWSRWLVMMLIPYLALLLIGAGLIFVIYKKGFALHMAEVPNSVSQPLTGA